jgi:GAF domain-containing protein
VPQRSVVALVEAARLVSSSLDLDVVLDALRDQARELVAADGASIHLLAPDGFNFVRRRLSPFANRGDVTIREGDLLRRDGFMHEAVESGCAVFARDFQNDPRVARDVGRVIPHVKSSLVAPIAAEGETLGILIAHWSRTVDLDDADCVVVEALARHAAVALRNARLHAAALDTARLEGAIKTSRSVAHSLNNDLARVVAAAELLQVELDGQPSVAPLLGTLLSASTQAAGFVGRLQQTLRFVEHDTPVGPALDVERATLPEAAG